MAQDIVNENQKISYTNLDFSAIYTETLNLIKQLTYKWDPSISDESDPGVVLVKLSALLADKLNYNIDKNVLETFPLSVTQDGNARQLYDQLGYYMDWYQSGQTDIAINWTGTADTDTSIKTYRIPKFTPICDTEQSSNKRYTIIGVEGAEDNVVSDVLITTDGAIVVARVMEGFPVQYQFEGETVITSQMVDPISRRLYFTTKYISQNGVFVKNTGQDNFAEWKRVNNLYENTYNELRYIFGYDSQTDTCYLEFPDNYAELIGSGIEITYLIIDPTGGDVMAQELTQFMAPIQTQDLNGNAITLSNDNVKILNYLASAGHADIEGIDEAYINYKRTVGTFKTLITLRDFLNYIRNEDLDICSNAFVCDRTNDVQSVYKIMNKGKDLTNLLVKVEQIVADQGAESVFNYKFILSRDSDIVEGKTYYEPAEDDNYLEPVTNPTGSPALNRYYELESKELETTDALEAFTLKFYMLRKAVSIDSLAAYNQTFTMLNPYPDFDSLFADTAHLEHTYGDILPIGKNYYKKSTDEAWSDTKSYYLYDTDEQDYTLITNLDQYISGDPPRDLTNVYDIKVEALMPHVIFFKAIYPVEMNISTYSVMDADTQSLIKTNIVNALYNQTSSSEMNFGEEASVDYLTRIVKESDARIKSVSISPLSYYLYATYFDDKSKSYIELYIDDDMGTFRPESYESETSIVAAQIKKDIVAKSILAGTTQLIIPDTEFIYHLPHKFLNYDENVITVSPEAVIDINDATTSYSVGNTTSTIRKTYTLKENETIKLLKPKLLATDSFLNGIHYEYVLNSVIEAKSSHKLTTGEYFIFYRANKDEATSTIGSYSAHAFGPGTIITPSFAVPKQVSVSSLSNFAKAQIVPQFELDNTLHNFIETTSNNTYMTEIRNSSSIVNNTIDGTDYININVVAETELTIADKFKYFWTLNKPIYSSNDNLKNYVLFDEYDSETDSKEYDEKNSYTLQSGELFFYTDDKFKNLYTIPSDCTLVRNCGVESSQYSEVTNTLYFAEINHLSSIVPNASFSTLTDSNDRIRPREQGLYEVLTFNTVVLEDGDNPFEMGLYEGIDGTPENPDYFIPTLDTSEDASKFYYTVYFVRTSDTTGLDTKDYYVLVMRKEPGYFYRSVSVGSDGIERESYVADTLDSGCFEAVKIKNLDNPTIINPVEEGYYKEMKYNNAYFIDDYSLASDIEPTQQYRYTQAARILSTKSLSSKGNEYLENDSNIFTRKILSGTIYPNIDISNPNTYVDMDLALDTFNTVSLELVRPTQYATYYKNNNGQAGDEVEVTYLTNPYMEKLWVLGDDDEKHPCFSLADDPDYIHFNPIIKELEASKNLALFRELESKFDTDIDNIGWYYKANEANTTYRAGTQTVPYLSVNRVEAEGATSPLDLLFTLYIQASNQYSRDATQPTLLLEYICNRWQTAVSFQAPYVPTDNEAYVETWVETKSYEYDTRVKYEENVYKCVVTNSTQGEWIASEWIGIDTCWRTASFTEDDSITIADITSYSSYYVLVDADTIIGHQINVGLAYPAFDKIIESEIHNPKFYISSQHASALELDMTAHPYIKNDEVGMKLDSDLKLASVFPNREKDITKYTTIQLYYVPKLYAFNDFVKYSDTTYYVKKELYKQHCGVIEPWSCKVIDKDALLENPNDEIKNDYKALQPDTSLTIIQNDSEIDKDTNAVFTEGDKLIFEVEDTSEESVVWPVFTNDGTKLDLNSYKVYFIKNGSNEIVEIKSIDVDGYYWKGYSSLIINSSNKSGQKLSSNHTIKIYDSEDSIEPFDIVDGSSGKNVSIQFKNSVTNQVGTYINVTTEDTLTKAPTPNAIYVYEPYQDDDYHKYNTVENLTSLLFNSVTENDSMRPQTITVPFGLPGGEYLLGAFMKEDVDLEVENRNLLNVNGTKYNLDAPVKEGNVYSLDFDYVNILHSYMNEDRTKFTGDRYDYIYMNTGDGRFRKLIAPSLILLSTSPKEMGLYSKDEDTGEYILSDNEKVGVDLVIPASENTDANPKEEKWYEPSGSSYKLTEDTEVVAGKTYYTEPELYVAISDVESSLIFSVTRNGEPFDSEPVTYTLDDIFKFEPNSAIGNFKAIREKVQQLDTDEEYAYTYVPSDNDKIENPLKPESFFNTNHVYNSFVIPQLDFENLDTRFITVARNR